MGAAQINTVEHIQEEFGHDIQEMKMQLTRLTKLIEGHTGVVSENICGSPSFPLQPILSPLIHQRHPGHESRIPVRDNVPPSVHHLHLSHEPQIPVRGNVPPRVHHPNWQPHAPTPTIIPTFRKASQLVDHVNSSENNLEKPKRNRDKNRWDPILVTYTELFPRLLERKLVALSHTPPIRPPFPKSFNSNVYCDYHMGKPGHSTEDCHSLKQQEQTLIEIGKINFKDSNQLSNLSLNFSGARTEKDKEFATISERVHRRKTEYTSEKTEE